MTAPDPRLNEIQARVDKTPPDHGHTQSWLPAADVRYLLAELRKAHEALERVEKVRKELFEFSKETSLAFGQCAAHRDSSRAIHTALRAAGAAAKGDERG